MDKNILKSSIIFIGPMHVGMDMVASAVSQKTGMDVVNVNKLRRVFYPKFGYNVEAANRIRQTKGIEAWYEYQKPYEAKLVEYVLTTFLTRPSIVTFGAGFSVYKDKELFAVVQKAMQPYKNVINLELPPNYKGYNKSAQSEINNNFIHNDCNYILSKFDVTVDVVDADFRNRDYTFSEYKFENLINNIITISGNKVRSK